jgi:dihydrofolate synthase/folylpolyglutamate synthase
LTYREVLERLLPARRFGIVLGLERMRGLLARLGDPERRLGAVVHVGGTNGKGSTAAMIAAIATAAGRRVAVYSSPHLSTLRERITAGGAMISEDDLVATAQEVWAAGGDALTFFEQVTAIALVWIAAQRPDITVLEVGLGGRLDATNVVDAEIAAVTGVALDHQAILGDTLAAIAREKAGIFKAGRRAVIGCSGEPEAVAELIAGARAAGVAQLTVCDAPAAGPVGLPGAHQLANAACALAAIDHLEALGALTAPPALRARALAEVRHPGRMERVTAPPGSPEIWLDGAHNPQGAAALAAAAADLPRPRALILAVSADKDVPALVAPLVAVFDHVVATRYQQPRSLGARDLAALLVPCPGVVAEAGTLPEALALARGAGARSVVIAGSLMLVGEARSLLLGAPTDPLVVTDPAP